ncbi:hypothetical protein CR532_05260 (plasmid) [Candidatus Borreliella tachyglossi]|uniref:Uncharacterized protein n=1 Tax=Candidatus Borreliella tachyglossi TaxID=1964448 RepID=A0A2S1LYG9_9SPIR|nr:DUF1322 family protein [Candidatus Borreliella tachyglossi]AWG43353.1 hypothetical protein CR532_04970 [Candidatus Borreliella tachyglossi]AWG43404.1 hypothetical protein CR532_05260 [Candidatus Borreliella tachyglossi]
MKTSKAVRYNEIKQVINQIHESRHQYFTLLEEIRNNKYAFPVIMGIATLSEVKRMLYNDLFEVNKLADFKLQKQVYELIFRK